MEFSRQEYWSGLPFPSMSMHACSLQSHPALCDPMASGPNHFMANRWGNSDRLYFWGSKITADGYFSHEIKTRLLLGRKVMTNQDSILKSRDITLPTKVYLVKAMVFPVVMYGCKSWTIKKAERWRIDAFELWCWEKTLESPLDNKEIQPVHSKGNQSWIFIGRTNAEAETPILRPPDAKSWLIWKDPHAGKDWRPEEKGKTEDEMVRWHHWLKRTWVWVNSRSWWWTGKPGVLQSTGSQRVRHNWTTELNWTLVLQAPQSMGFSRQEY